MKLKPLIIKNEVVPSSTRVMLTPEQYSVHLKQKCGLTDQETKIVLANVYKRIEKDFVK